MTDTHQGDNNAAETILDQTPEVQTATQDAAPENTGADSAPPSSAQDTQAQTNEPESMEDAIANALAVETPKDDANPDEPSDAGDKADDDKGDKTAEVQDQDKSDATAEEGDDKTNDDDDPSDDELKAMRPNVAKRVKKLLHQRNEARREVESYRTDADELRQIREFTRTNNLADNEVADLFKFGALVKSGDVTRLNQALEIVMPIVTNLMEATGRSVPKDLRAKVESGELSEEMARQMGRERFERKAALNTAERTKAQATEQQQQAEQTANQERAAKIREATANWYTSKAASDPDFGMKAEAMEAAARALVAERGQPKTPEEAVKLAEDALAQATKWLTAGRSNKTATRPTPGNGSNGSRSAVTPNPSSMEEAIAAALRATPA